MTYIGIRYKLLLILGLFALQPISAQQSNRTTEEEVNTQKVFIDANKEKILGNFENAVYLYKEVLKRDKGNHAAAYELARVYDVLGNDGKALSSIKLAIDLDKANPWYQMFQADVYDKQKKYKDAAKIYEKLADQDPNNEYYYSKWAFYLVKAKDAGKAVKVYDKLEQRIGLTESIIHKKQSLYVGMGNIKKAIGELEKLIEAYPSRLDYRHDLAEFYQRMGESKKAKAVYQTIIELDPNDGKAAIALAGEPSKASSEVTFLQSLQPIFRKPDVDIDLKIKQLIPFIQKVANSGDKELATAGLELTEILSNVHPNEAKSYSAHADLLYYSGQTDEALVQYKKAIERGFATPTIPPHEVESLHQDARLLLATCHCTDRQAQGSYHESHLPGLFQSSS
ncbi:MAG: tetratricopeptide repeat protein, partial [Bacteroidota bacterium]